MNKKAAILAVDDNSESLALLVKILTPEGYQVRPADSGELAMAAVNTNPPDLILLDVLMKGMDGLEVCRQLKAQEETQHIPIILISPFANVKDWVEGLWLGASDYITKPFRTEELLTRVKTHLELRQATVSLEQQTAALHHSNEQLQMEIAERKQTHVVLRESEERFRNLAELLPEIVFETGLNGRITFINEMGIEGTGYSDEDFKSGLSAGQLLIAEDRERVRKNMSKVLHGEKSGENEYTALRKDGSTYPIAVYSRPIISEGKTIGMRGIIIDITKRK